MINLPNNSDWIVFPAYNPLRDPFSRLFGNSNRREGRIRVVSSRPNGAQIDLHKVAVIRDILLILNVEIFTNFL